MSVPGIILDTPTLADAGEISAVAQTSFRQTFAARDYPPDDLASFLNRAMSERAYAAQIADADYGLRVARDATGAIIGFVKTGANGLPMSPGEPDRAMTRELHQLYLLDAAKGSGIADAMMRWVESDARSRGAVALYLSVYIDNHRARRFYARHGFVEIGRNPFPVGKVIDDDRVWRKWL